MMVGIEEPYAWVCFVLLSDYLRDAESKGQHRLLLPLQSHLHRPGGTKQFWELSWGLSDRQWWGTSVWKMSRQMNLKHLIMETWQKFDLMIKRICVWIVSVVYSWRIILVWPHQSVAFKQRPVQHPLPDLWGHGFGKMWFFSEGFRVDWIDDWCGEGKGLISNPFNTMN